MICAKFTILSIEIIMLFYVVFSLIDPLKLKCVQIVVKIRFLNQEAEQRDFYKPLIVLCILLLLFSFPVRAIDRVKVKAQYLKSLSSYATWPKSSIQAKNASFDLCILGENNFKNYLQEIYTEKARIKNKSVRVLYINKAHEAAGCHVLFISRSEDEKISEILAYTEDKPILTISEIRGFVEQNGLFQFYMKGQKVGIKGNKILFKGHVIKVNPILSQVIKFH